MTRLDCFKAYDVRGKLGETLDDGIAARIGAAFGHVLGARRVVVGHDARETSPTLKARRDPRVCGRSGVDVTDIGLCGTEEVYFATGHLGADGGLMVTASHNPIEYNGMKLVGPGSRPIDPGTELSRIRETAERQDWTRAAAPGALEVVDLRDAYAARVAGFARGLSGKRFRIVADAGNGTAGAAFDAVLARLVAAGQTSRSRASAMRRTRPFRTASRTPSSREPRHDGGRGARGGRRPRRRVGRGLRPLLLL